MGCNSGSNAKIVDIKLSQDAIEGKRKIIEELEKNNAQPTDEQKTLIVRYNIEIYQQIDEMTKALKAKSNKDLKKRLEVLITTFNDLIVRWKKISKEDEEEVQLKLMNENA